MPTDDRQVLVVGQESTPASYTIPGNGQITPRSIFAHYNGASAASPFQPAIKVISDGGETVGVYPCNTSVAAGGSADVSWFPGVGGGASSGTLQALIGARIIATSTQTVNDSTQTDLVYQSVDFDTDGMANLGSNNRILTINTPGLYLVLCQTDWPYDSAGRRLNQIVKNGYYGAGALPDAGDSRMAIWAPVGGDGAGNPHTTNLAAALFDCVAGDFFSSGCLQASGAALNCNGFGSGGGGRNSFLSAVAIGTL